MIVTIDELKDIRVHHENKNIVLTNGTFDMLHVGHLRYLNAVKRYGEILVVLLSSDVRVRARKGPERPVISENDRAQMLDALKVVDYVMIDPANFKLGSSDPVYAKILALLKPDEFVTDSESTRFTADILNKTKMIVLRRDEASNSEEEINTSTTATIERVIKTRQSKR